MRHTRRGFLAAAGLASTGAGCLGVPGSDISSPSSRTDVSLLLNWKPSGLHVPYYVAKRNGYYRDEGLTVTRIKDGQGSDFSAKQAGLGNEPFVVTSADQVINARSRDLSPRSVGVVMQHSPVVVFTARDVFGDRLTAASQLAGKTVGTGPGMVRLLTKVFLEERGVLGDVDLVDSGYDTVQQLLAGQIDAAGGVFGDAVAARHKDHAVDSLRVSSAIPSYGHVVATSEQFASDHPETVRAFLRATAHGSAWGTERPNEAIDRLVEMVPSLAESRGIQLDKWTVMARQYVLSRTVRSRGWGYSEPTPWNTLYSTLRDAGSLGGQVDPATAWTNDYLDEDAKYVGEYANAVTGD